MTIPQDTRRFYLELLYDGYWYRCADSPNGLFSARVMAKRILAEDVVHHWENIRIIQEVVTVNVRQIEMSLDGPDEATL